MLEKNPEKVIRYCSIRRLPDGEPEMLGEIIYEGEEAIEYARQYTESVCLNDVAEELLRFGGDCSKAEVMRLPSFRDGRPIEGTTQTLRIGASVHK